MPIRFTSRLAALLAITALVLGASPDFDTDVRPILSQHCFQCHGEQVRMGELDLRTAAAMVMGGVQGPALRRGSANDSLLYRRVVDKTMPMGEKKLSAEQVRLIGEWIDAGAHGGEANEQPASSSTTEAVRPKGFDHWAFEVARRPELPQVQDETWVRTPIDRFIKSRLEDKGIQPVGPAAKRTLLRRAYLTLIGLPPTPREVQAFLDDDSPGAYEKAVDDLLSRPQYGERWARHWLDVVRYAESNGYERDGAKPHAWRYRDYVINSLNKDKPFDRFLTEQLAGDEIEGSNAESQIGATFLRLGSWDDEPVDPRVDRYDQLDDVLGVTATTFLGLSIRCARCHDHKFEPLSQEDYYRMLAVFEPLQRPQDNRTDLDRLVGSEEELAAYRTAIERAKQEVGRRKGEIAKLRKAVMKRALESGNNAVPSVNLFDHSETLSAMQKQPERRNDREKELVAAFEKKLDTAVNQFATLEEAGRIETLRREIETIELARPPEPPRAYVWYEDTAIPPVTRVLARGDTTQPTTVVDAEAPTVVGGTSLDPQERPLYSTGRRLALARWMTSPENPLVARVMVNRIWQWYFGEGLVASENDFGVAGARPTHPRLLDYLATEFIDSGWSLKHIHRLIANSAAFQLSSTWDDASGRVDAENRLLWRWRPRRMEAETVRDSMLAVSGRLNPKMGGPSIFPKLPQAVLDGQSVPGKGWETSNEEEASRRSIYIFIKRSLAVPELDLLDTPDSSSSCEQRRVSTTGPQALTFLNGEFTHQRAGDLAARLTKETGDGPAAQVRRAFALTLGRPPTEQQVGDALDFLAKQAEQIQADDAAAGREAGDAKMKALEAFCLILLNTNEFFYLS